MATIFLEPGGDSTFTIGLWPNNVNTPTVATDFVHTGHVKSIKYATNSSNYLLGSNFLSDTGGRVSVWVYFNALPTTDGNIFLTEGSGDGAPEVGIHIKPTGIVYLVQNDGTTQIGSNGPTLSTGKWYRICYCWTVTSSTVNQLRLFVFDSTGTNSLGTISVSNATLQSTGIADLLIGNGTGDLTFDMRSSDHYIDNSTALTDPGNIWVTAKRPNANGTTNGFTTQIGSGGSGYPASGGGHSPQVNERPNSDTDGWSVTAAGSAITEEYNIEGQAVGDINITGSTIVDYMGWVRSKALVSETGKIIVNGVSSNIALTSTIAFFTKIAGSTTYPAGTGTDIGEISATTATTVSLYEAGIIVAYIPAATKTANFFSFFRP